MRSHSLVRRITATVLVAQFLCALIFSGIALEHERNSRLRAFDVRLQGRSDSLLGAIQDAEDPEDNVTIDPRELRIPAEDVFAVYNHNGRLIGTSSNAPTVLIQRSSDGFRDQKAERKKYRVYQRDAMRVIDRAEYGGVGLSRPVTIIYASPENHLWHEILEAASFYLIAISVAAIATGIIVIVFVKRALSPLEELAEAACTISAPALEFAPPASALRLVELRPLADIISSVVNDLREAFAKQRQFVGDAAHELKTAVAVVRSTVQVLMMKPRTADEYEQGLANILNDNLRVEALVSQMLQLARSDEGRSQTAAVTDLSLCAIETTHQLQSVSMLSGVTLRCNAPSENPVRLRPEQASTIIANLIQNAIQHSPAGTSIEIAVKSTQNQVNLQVKDHGYGISAEALPHVFDRFFREDSSRSRETGGAGLGLAICKSIVESAGGTIQLHSEPGVGTTALVTFTKA